MPSRIVRGIRRAARIAWPQASARKVPERVYTAIDRYDQDSEVLVKIMQFGIFAIWGLVYWASPKPDPDTVSRVPLVISIYLIFTLARFFIALGRRSPAWFIYPSTVIDMGLLTYLIWSFHLQYDQPASFSLKAVEVLNYFVLIALRALRFQSRYVWTAGLSAIAFWAVLVAYVTLEDPWDPMVTRDYVTYLTSNSVLIGAEVSKMMSILMFTLILAIVVRRAQHLLVSSVTEEEAVQDLSRFVGHGVVDRIRGSQKRLQAGQGVRRKAAILNVDIRGFTTRVAPMEPTDAMALLADYQHHVLPIVQRHGGTVDKFMGDGIMITFGASMDDPRYCANAVRCMEELIAASASWEARSGGISINMAATAGDVIFGAVGYGDRLELTVIGPSVNRSAKLEKHNKVLGTKALCGINCYTMALEQGYKPATKHRQVEALVDGNRDPFEVMVLA
ncbi:MAG: adenylate/guanylate cyclase domain-containing protein [Pseudomonadota bacterium]